MIARIWHGWTTPENASAYESLLRGEVLPEIEGVAGCTGAWVLRREEPDRVEFVTLILFASLAAVRDFAGTDYGVPVISVEARSLLAEANPIAEHYDVIIAPGGTGTA